MYAKTNRAGWNTGNSYVNYVWLIYYNIYTITFFSLKRCGHNSYVNKFRSSTGPIFLTKNKMFDWTLFYSIYKKVPRIKSYLLVWVASSNSPFRRLWFYCFKKKRKGLHCFIDRASVINYSLWVCLHVCC